MFSLYSTVEQPLSKGVASHFRQARSPASSYRQYSRFSTRQGLQSGLSVLEELETVTCMTPGTKNVLCECRRWQWDVSPPPTPRTRRAFGTWAVRSLSEHFPGSVSTSSAVSHARNFTCSVVFILTTAVNCIPKRMGDGHQRAKPAHQERAEDQPPGRCFYSLKPRSLTYTSSPVRNHCTD